MKEFDDYDIKYPDLVIQILEYFKVGSFMDKCSVQEFCEMYSDQRGRIIYQPTIVNRICQILCEKNKLSILRQGGVLGLQNNYGFVISDEKAWKVSRDYLRGYYNSLVYGFEYIYNLYKDIVVPVVWEKENGDYSVGTAFRYRGGIVTAKHCIEDPQNISIKGFQQKH